MIGGGQNRRVVSGMRPTGKLHLGNYHGALKNWIKLQHEYECFYFVADWHALTTDYEDPGRVAESTWEVVLDWLAAGLDPGSATLFLQSRVPEHAELHLLTSMLTPLAWLTRVPSYKEQQRRLKDKDLSTYGFLGYPLLQSADILIYRPAYVPVGEDQVAHVELTREVARRFNFLYGRGPDFEKKARDAMRRLGGKKTKLYKEARRKYQEQGDASALEAAQAMVESHPTLTIGDRDHLLGYLEGSGLNILVEPDVLLTETPKVPGTDGQKMSKSYDNTIGLREDPDSVAKKLRTMQTDPARVRRTDPGEPEKCPVWSLHKIYSSEDTREWVQQGCRTAGIGCLQCKQPLIDSVLEELGPIRERGAELEQNMDMVRAVMAEGSEEARDAARETMEDVRRAVGLAR